MAYVSNHETIELLLQRAEALRKRCESAAPANKPAIAMEWEKAMQVLTDAMVKGKMPK